MRKDFSEWRRWIQDLTWAIRKHPLTPSSLAFFITSTWAILHVPLEVFWVENIVSPILSKIESHWIYDIMFFSGMIAFTYNLETIGRSKKIYNALLIGSLLLCFYFWQTNDFSFLSLYWCAPLPYLSFPCFLLTLFWLYFLAKWVRRKIERDKGKIDDSILVHDSPLSSKEASLTDKLNYKGYAEEIARLVKKSKFKSSFAISINGRWGSGKTSFISLVVEQLEKFSGAKPVVVYFNPWSSHNSSSIISDFFQHLLQSLKPYSPQLAHSFKQYGQALLTTEIAGIKEVMKLFSDFITSDLSLEGQLKDINQQLEVIDKKLIIIIDDLDRLEPKEILEVLKLVRNTADFYNTFYILGYDKEYIANAMNSAVPFGKETFLEKIIQLEVSLPHFPREALLQKLVSSLEDKVPVDFLDVLKMRWEIDRSIFEKWVVTMRDVSRLANQIILNLKHLKGEIDYVDFLLLELLRGKCPSVHRLLYERVADIFKFEDNNGAVKNFNYVLIGAQEEGHGFGHKYEKSKLNTYLTTQSDKHSLSGLTCLEVVELVGQIFSSDLRGGGHLNRHHDLSVRNPSKFGRYFSYSVWNSSLSELEFQQVRQLESAMEITDRFNEWIGKGVYGELLDRIYEIQNFDSMKDFEKIMTAIIILANYVQNNHRAFFELGVTARSFAEKRSEFRPYSDHDFQRKIINFYSSLNNRPDQNEVVSLLDTMLRSKQGYPYLFQAKFINSIISDFDSNVEDFPLKKKELKLIAIENFSVLCESETNFRPWIVSYFPLTRYRRSERVENGGVVREIFSYPDEVLDQFKQFVTQKDPDGFMKHTISNSGDSKYSMNINEIEDVWGNVHNFIAEFTASENVKLLLGQEKLDEYRLFVQKVISEGSKGGTVRFEFWYIQPNPANNPG